MADEPLTGNLRSVPKGRYTVVVISGRIRKPSTLEILCVSTYKCCILATVAKDIAA